MARPRLITDEELLGQLDRYYMDVCRGDASMMKIPAFGDYIRKDPLYVGVKDYTIRRCAAVRDRIRELKKGGKQGVDARVAVFQATPTEMIDRVYCDRKELARFIHDRDCYYESLTNYAAKCINRYRNLEKERDEQRAEAERLRIRNEKLQADLKKVRAELQEEKERYNALKAAARTACDNAAAGLLQGPGSPFSGDLPETIQFDTQVRSQRNKSLAEELEDDFFGSEGYKE